jgi:ribosomal protein L29
VKGYSTKYCLTGGVEEVHIDLDYSRSSEASTVPGYEHLPEYVYTRSASLRQQLVAGKDFFLTRKEAAAVTVKEATSKIKGVRKQIARLEGLIEIESLAAKS